MLIKIAPGSWREDERDLVDVLETDTYNVNASDVLQVFDYARTVDQRRAALIALLVEKGLLTLAECAQYLDAPQMEKA